MPDGPRKRSEPVVRIEPRKGPQRGFTASNTSRIDAAGLAALNAVLDRLMERGLNEHEAKEVLLHAVAKWLEPGDATEADIERLLAWR